MHQTATDLTFDEQAELNQGILHKIKTKLPQFIAKLEQLNQNISSHKKTHSDQIKELKESLDEKLNMLQEQENEKVELMMEWLNHRVYEVSQFSDNSSELLTLKTKILDLKSK
jgi:methyl-accepting chemotaxis protein